MSKYKIAITDDEALFRKGLHHILSNCDNCKVVFEAKNGLDLLSKLESTSVMPEIILLDIQMPKMDGVDTLKTLQKKYPNIRVIILTSHYNPTLIVKMIELGASSFMQKNINPDELTKSIKNVIDKGFDYNDYTLQLLREKMLQNKPKGKTLTSSLTKREKEVLRLICDQYTNKEIADELFISTRTVEGHRNKLIEKSKSKNTAGLIIYAIENGIYSLKLSSMLLK